MQTTQYLFYGITTIIINNQQVALPEEILTSLKKRGKKSKNFIFDTENNYLSIYCITCKKYHPAYKFENGKWMDISEGVYVKSRERKTNKLYFGSECKLVKSLSYVLKNNSSNRVKTTIILTEENAEFISIASTLLKKSRNDFINEVIDKYTKRNPLSKFFNLKEESTD